MYTLRKLNVFHDTEIMPIGLSSLILCLLFYKLKTACEISPFILSTAKSDEFPLYNHLNKYLDDRLYLYNILHVITITTNTLLKLHNTVSNPHLSKQVVHESRERIPKEHKRHT